MGRSDGVLVIGGSAGGVEALIATVARLPADLPVPVLVTVHVGPGAHSNLPRILTRAGPLPAAHARDGEPLRAGWIHVAPPDLHLLVGDGRVRLSSGARVNRHRPAVDVMFASAARWAGPGVVAVVLSGMLDDGAVGAALVARAGGRVVVQDPADALFASMPRAALAAVPGAAVASTPQLAVTAAAAVADLVPETDGEEPDMAEPRMADSDDPGFLRPDETRLTRLSCPECSGGLAETQLGGIRYYRCHVGHQYAPQSLEAAQRDATEAKLWAAAAALEEHAALARHLATHADGAVGDTVVAEYRDNAERSAETARVLISGLAQRRPAAPPTPPVPPGPAAGAGSTT